MTVKRSFLLLIIWEIHRSTSSWNRFDNITPVLIAIFVCHYLMTKQVATEGEINRVSNKQCFESVERLTIWFGYDIMLLKGQFVLQKVTFLTLFGTEPESERKKKQCIWLHYALDWIWGLVWVLEHVLYMEHTRCCT
jgi:hypothetical protein